jgi:hypothetical protein
VIRTVPPVSARAPLSRAKSGDGGNRTHAIGPTSCVELSQSSLGEVAQVVLVPLRDRKGAPRAYALIDPEDAPRVLKYRWSLRSIGRESEYPSAVIDGRTVSLHAFLCPAPTGMCVDHKNGWRLDNRRSNLRVASPGENAQNQHARVGSSRYRGVCWDKARAKWIAYGTLNYRRQTIGRFDSEDEAGAAAAAWRREHMPFSEEAS